MDQIVRNVASARTIRAFTQARIQYTSQASSSSNKGNLPTIHQLYISTRAFHISRSNSTNTAPPTKPPSKPIVLEKPDKFRPPSHAARRNARSTTSMYGAGAAYNQGMSEKERIESKKKSYPHMFPEEGTTMHWFLTTRWVHVSITMVS